jgi:hypothetical protein
MQSQDLLQLILLSTLVVICSGGKACGSGKYCPCYPSKVIRAFSISDPDYGSRYTLNIEFCEAPNDKGPSFCHCHIYNGFGNLDDGSPSCVACPPGKVSIATQQDCFATSCVDQANCGGGAYVDLNANVCRTCMTGTFSSTGKELSTAACQRLFCQHQSLS